MIDSVQNAPTTPSPATEATRSTALEFRSRSGSELRNCSTLSAAPLRLEDASDQRQRLHRADGLRGLAWQSSAWSH